MRKPVAAKRSRGAWPGVNCGGVRHRPERRRPRPLRGGSGVHPRGGPRAEGGGEQHSGGHSGNPASGQQDGRARGGPRHTGRRGSHCRLWAEEGSQGRVRRCGAGNTPPQTHLVRVRGEEKQSKFPHELEKNAFAKEQIRKKNSHFPHLSPSAEKHLPGGPRVAKLPPN